ncbi:MAG: hypothetical protein HC911_12810 [Chloroflexaceae bacterium]|nr:hypothetical protein [Chloroflexaceae bacterium]
MNPFLHSISPEQVITLVEQLTPDEQARVLHTLLARLIGDRSVWLAHLQQHGESHLRHLAAKHGYDWDSLDDTARLAFVDDLLHEALP